MHFKDNVKNYFLPFQQNLKAVIILTNKDTVNKFTYSLYRSLL